METIDSPYSEISLDHFLARHLAGLEDEVEKLTDDQIASNRREYLVTYFLEKYRIEPLIIGEEDPGLREQEHCKIDLSPSSSAFRNFSQKSFDSNHLEVDGVAVTFSYNFTGSSELLRCKARTFSVGPYPSIKVSRHRIVLRHEYQLSKQKMSPSKEEVFADFKSSIDELRRGAEFVNQDIARFNTDLPKRLDAFLNKRIQLAESFTNLFNDLEIPINRKEGSSQPIPLKKKPLKLVSRSKKSGEENHTISNEGYLDILHLIKNFYATCECMPATYTNLNEEALRNLALATLNVNFEGQATGETFRKNGKTDICVEAANRAAFVAECKIWKGRKKFQEAIHQLLSYLTWRDSKTALIIFSRAKNFNAVLSSAKDSLNSMDECRDFDEIEKNEFACKFISGSDTGDITQIRVMIFNLYADTD